jgi:ppGpp synthetase/RelA/SpoT-type nucleotidyltranferase
MYIYKVCLVNLDISVFQFRHIGQEFESRAEAEAWMKNADLHGYKSVHLIILEIYKS